MNFEECEKNKTVAKWFCLFLRTISPLSRLAQIHLLKPKGKLDVMENVAMTWIYQQIIIRLGFSVE